MIFLDLFLTFFQIGAVSFGGGYGMLSLIREKVVAHGWLNENELLNLIAVAESTPGPIAVNTATFVGSTQGGILGSICATLGVVLPSFIIILIIATLIRNFLAYAGVQAFLNGVRPCVVGLIIATALNLFLSTILHIETLTKPFSIDFKGLGIFLCLLLIGFLLKRFFKKKPSPILMILFSAGMGMILYAF